MFSVMSTTAQLLERLPQHLRQSNMLRLAQQSTASLLTTGSQLESAQGEKEQEKLLWQDRLQQGKLAQGGVVEIAVSGGAALATSVSLNVCRFAQQRTQELYGETAWCAFADPAASLYAPGLRATGVDLSRLLIVRPDEDALGRVALKLVESQVFPVVVIDTMGICGAEMEQSLASWVKIVRRLSLALSGSQGSAILLTNQHARRPLPLPVLQRIELSRHSGQEISVNVPRCKSGAYLPPARLQFSRPSVSKVRPVKEDWSHAG